MFHPTQTALDIFGDKNKSDARRRCQPGPGADAESVLLFDMHLKVAIAYLVVYQGLKAMPFCRDQLVPLMEAGGYPLSLIEDGDPSTDTPWGLAKAYADEIDAYLIENDGWNADGSMSRDFNRVPFSDFDITDSEGNSWEKYVPRNTPYKVSRLGRRCPREVLAVRSARLAQRSWFLEMRRQNCYRDRSLHSCTSFIAAAETIVPWICSAGTGYHRAVRDFLNPLVVFPFAIFVVGTAPDGVAMSRGTIERNFYTEGHGPKFG